MVFIVILFVAAFIFLAPHVFFAFITNIGKTVYYGIKDMFDSVIHKKSLLFKAGQIVGYVGYFGKGKTLSAVHHVCAIYRAKHGKRVFCPRRKKWVTQLVQVVSNVNLKKIPYIRFTSLEQVVRISDTIIAEDDEKDTLTITLFLLDEAGAELNSREFRSNLDPLVLNSILTVRHCNMSFYYTAQRFCHVDALLRQVTAYVVSCNKIWRFMFQKEYDGWEMEQASNPTLIQCKRVNCFFIRDKDFEMYDTYQCVDKLRKDVIEGKMLSPEEALALRVGYDTANMDGVINYSKKYRKRHKRLY